MGGRERPLTLTDVPDDWLIEFGLRRGAVTAASFNCTDPNALLVPLTDLIVPPARLLNADAIRSLLGGISTYASIPPIPVFREPGAPSATLLDGMHRYRVSLAVGFVSIPSIQPNREDAELVYCYARPR